MPLCGACPFVAYCGSFSINYTYAKPMIGGSLRSSNHKHIREKHFTPQGSSVLPPGRALTGQDLEILDHRSPKQSPNRRKSEAACTTGVGELCARNTGLVLLRGGGLLDPHFLQVDLLLRNLQARCSGLLLCCCCCCCCSCCCCGPEAPRLASSLIFSAGTIPPAPMSRTPATSSIRPFFLNR